ncbi:ABC transporter permease [Halomonas binhaiensis]|uniref:ABC transporter permease n=1 Tax=Halomonas binhaiensis TaxID=2562282 RepID=UPI001F071DA0|nr:ABC transporter permease [Halomonas binhaiensis]
MANAEYLPDSQVTVRASTYARLLLLAPLATATLLIVPVLVGLAGAAGPAFGWLPVLGGKTLSLDPWRALLDTPGLASMIRLSLVTGIASTAIALVIVVLFLGAFADSRAFIWLRRLLSPLLAVPHAAAAIGLAFLLAPSGLAMRLISPGLSGFHSPPDYLFPGDGGGMALIAGLVIKEVPFLLLMSLAALSQCQAEQRTHLARSLGYAPTTAFLKAVLPTLYPLIRLPIYAVIAFASANVDVAMILGPSTPPPLAVSVVHWLNDPDLSKRFMASAAALTQLGITLLALAGWWLMECLVACLGRRWLTDGRRHTAHRLGLWLGGGSAWISVTLLGASLIALILWSLATWWPFPVLWPTPLSLANWQRALDGLWPATLTTLALALSATLFSSLLVVGCLEHETVNRRTMGTGASLILYLPLLVPPVAFLFGLVQLQAQLQACLALSPGFLSAALGHCLFVLPYVFLSLAESYRRLDPRWSQLSASLGRSPAYTFVRVRLPMLLAPIAVAMAVGLAVSIGQYLPTLLLSAGRLTTLTTEAITLASGGDRRLTAVYALAQLLLPALGFAIALWLPRLLHHHRRALQN